MKKTRAAHFFRAEVHVIRANRCGAELVLAINQHRRRSQLAASAILKAGGRGMSYRYAVPLLDLLRRAYEMRQLRISGTSKYEVQRFLIYLAQAAT